MKQIRNLSCRVANQRGPGLSRSAVRVEWLAPDSLGSDDLRRLRHRHDPDQPDERLRAPGWFGPAGSAAARVPRDAPDVAHGGAAAGAGLYRGLPGPARIRAQRLPALGSRPRAV